MQFSLLDFKMNDTCDGMNFTDLTKLLLLHYFAKVMTWKMLVNTTVAFNVNYKTVVTCIKYVDSFIKFLMSDSYTTHQL